MLGPAILNMFSFGISSIKLAVWAKKTQADKNMSRHDRI